MYYYCHRNGLLLLLMFFDKFIKVFHKLLIPCPIFFSILLRNFAFQTKT